MASGPWDDYPADGPWADYAGPAASTEMDQPQAQPVEQPAPAPHKRTIMESFRMGVGDVAQGAGELLGLVTNPLNAIVNATGIPQALGAAPLGTDMGQAARDATGAPKPESETERLASMAIRSGVGALGTAGIGQVAASGLGGVAGNVAREIGANPVRDLIAGLAGGVGSEVGQDIGGVPGAIVGGLAGQFAGAGALRLGERAAEAIATRFPRSAMLDASGGLTEDAREIALRTGADPEEILKSYARVREGRGPRPTAGGQARREALRNDPNRPATIMVDGKELLEVPLEPGSPAADPSQALDTQTQAITAAIGQRLPQAQAGSAAASPGDGTLLGDATSEGIRLTRGQAEQDFSVQNDENSLRVSANGDGNAAREFFANQQEQIRTAVDRFRSMFGSTDALPVERGQQLKDAVSDLRDHGAEGVRQFYRAAEELGGDGLRLDTQGIRDAATDILIDESVPEPVKRAVSQELARYGIIGEAAPMNEAGLTRVTLEDGSTVQFRGPVKELVASNAEDLRKAINRLYDPTKPNQSGQSLKPAIDDALEDAITGLPDAEGQIGAAYQAARAGYREQRQTFHAKDIIESLHANKKGTQTPVVMPERAIAAVLGQGPKAISNIRSVRNLLTSSGQPSAQQAWRGIQAQTLADIFEASVQRNVNTGGNLFENISGAKLRTQIFDKFGTAKLREILDPEEFNQLMKLQRVIGAATIPLSGTTNPSGTFTKIANLLGKHTIKMTGGFGDAIISLGSKARMAAASRKTLRGITSYDGPAAQSFVREYLDSGSAGKLVPATISVSGAQSGGQHKE